MGEDLEPPYPRRRRTSRRWGAVIVATGLSSCGSSGHVAAPSTTTSGASTTTTPTPTPTPTTAEPPPFAETATTVTPADLPHSWRPGCPLSPTQLRLLHLTYWGFDGHAHTGTMVINATVVASVTSVFRTLYAERFPLAEMVPVDAYGGSDNAAAAADDTSGFNCRYAVAPGPPQWSVHAFGEAIDVNDLQNPYVDGSVIIPPAGAAYLDRANQRPGMAVAGGALVRAFAAVGWQWGGRWNPGTDYQHFSLTGG